MGLHGVNNVGQSPCLAIGKLHGREDNVVTMAMLTMFSKFFLHPVSDYVSAVYIRCFQAQSHADASGRPDMPAGKNLHRPSASAGIRLALRRGAALSG
jgi:hypothetical protein